MQFGLNIFLALVWAFLHTSFTAVTFAIGYLIGAVIIFVLSWISGKQQFYLHRVFIGIKLFLIFIRELFVASMQVLYQVLQPKLKIRPGIIKMDIYIDTPLQITILTNMITLTPGTMTVEVAADNSAIFIHNLDIRDADAVCANIEKKFEKNIWEMLHR